MTIKREAAYHEAAHAVVANLSKYHIIHGGINLLNYGAGEFYAALSRSKCAARGKPQDPSAAKDKDVAKDFAILLCAGLVGEQIASEHDDTLAPDPECAEPDHALAQQQLQLAGLSEKYDIYQEQAREILKVHWNTVEKLAAYLLEHNSASPEEIASIIGDT